MCHSEELLRQQHLTTAQWTSVVQKMTSWGAPVEPEDRAPLVLYLAASYGADAGPYTPARFDVDNAAAALAPLPDGPFAGGDAARGTKVFSAFCAPCHGPSARGQIGVNLVDRPILYRSSDVASMVRHGRGRMTPLPSTTDAQIADILAYLRTLRGP
jgi:ubiquinol-cytochrome c reductase cytochrome c subunit